MPLETDRQKGAHLLRRFGMGATDEELDDYLRDGLNGAVDRLLESGDDGFSMTPIDFMGSLETLHMAFVASWWTTRMLSSRRPLREKMTLFWHDHFATSASKVGHPRLMWQQNETFRRNATGSFRTMLHEVAKDPAMIHWLDNRENVVGKPNENFARELMELFTLGVDQGYTERDVQEAARAFTGWSFTQRRGSYGVNEGEFSFDPRRHDSGEKVVLGRRGNLSGEDVIDLLCERPRTAEYLTRKIWEWFVYPNPSPKTLAPFAKRFLESKLDLGALLKDIMRSSDFYSPKAERAIVKNPVDFCVVTLRQLGYGEGIQERIKKAPDTRHWHLAVLPINSARDAMMGMGMWLLYPPDVAGWDIGQGWISTSTMAARMMWAERLFDPKGRRYPIRHPAYPLLSGNPTPAGVVDRLLAIFDAEVKPERRPLMLKAAEKEMGNGLTAANAGATAAAVCRLIFATPEFQMA